MGVPTVRSNCLWRMEAGMLSAKRRERGAAGTRPHLARGVGTAARFSPAVGDPPPPWHSQLFGGLAGDWKAPGDVRPTELFGARGCGRAGRLGCNLSGGIR